MDTRTTQTMSKEDKVPNSSKYQKMYDNLINEDIPFQNLHERVNQIKKQKQQKQTK